MRIGQGYDVHALVKGRKLIIGGVTIPFEKGLAGHSDADVLVHAVCDALLGAAALGDIGRHFPDSDPKYKNADSRVFLREVGGSRLAPAAVERAARELLALQASDWAFLDRRGQAGDYPYQRSTAHARALLEAIHSREPPDPRMRNLAPDLSLVPLLEP